MTTTICLACGLYPLVPNRRCTSHGRYTRDVPCRPALEILGVDRPPSAGTREDWERLGLVAREERAA